GWRRASVQIAMRGLMYQCRYDKGSLLFLAGWLSGPRLWREDGDRRQESGDLLLAAGQADIGMPCRAGGVRRGEVAGQASPAAEHLDVRMLARAGLNRPPPVATADRVAVAMVIGPDRPVNRAGVNLLAIKEEAQGGEQVLRVSCLAGSGRGGEVPQAPH